MPSVVIRKFMRLDFLKRYVAILLLICLTAFPLCACSGKKPVDRADTERKLVVNKTEVSYTREQKEYIASCLLEAFCNMLYKAEGIKLGDAQKQNIVRVTETCVIPAFIDGGVLFEDFEKLSVGNFAPESIADAARLYIDCVSVTGSRTASTVFYELSLAMLEIKRETAQKRYDRYGYSWYLEDAKRYARQASDLENKIGRGNFERLAGMLSFCIFSAGSADIFGNGETSDELPSLFLTFVRRQSSMLAGHMDKEQWGAAARLIFELVFCENAPSSEISPAGAAMWYSMEELSEQAEKFGEALESLFELYFTAARRLMPEDAALICSEDRGKSLSALCRAISGCKDELISFAEKLTEVEISSEKQREILEKKGLIDRFYEYADVRGEVTPEGIFEAIRACGEYGGESDEYANRIKEMAEDVIFSVSPYTAFAFVYEKYGVE